MDSLPLETCLNKLKCSICNCFLSVFPIFAIKDGKDSQLSSVCGRCQVPSENENLIILRNEIYENLAKIIKFPCIYQENGCMEKVLPETMKQHEAECYYRNVNCCLYEKNNCEWKGFRYFQQLFKHFEIEHQDLFLKDLQFEFNLFENHNVTNILLYRYELFLFKRNFKQETNQLNCSLIPLGLYYGREKYYGQINLSTTDATISKNLPEIHVALNNSESVDLNIHMLNGTDSKVVGTIKIAESEEELNSIYFTEQFQQQLSKMKCCLCKEKRTICSYREDGFLCLDCHTECSNNVTPSDQLAKKVGRRILLKCPYNCGYLVKDLTNHYGYCLFKPIDCVFVEETNCLWKDRRLDLFEHLLQNHEQAIVKLNEFEQLKINLESTLRHHVITKYFHYYDRLFKFEITIQHPKVSFCIEEVQRFINGVCSRFEFEIVLQHVRNEYLAANFKIVAKDELDYDFLMDQMKDSNSISFKYKINISEI